MKKSVTATPPRGIRLRADGKYIADVYHNGKRVTRVASSLEEAIAIRENILMEQQSCKVPASKASCAATATTTATSWTLETAYEKALSLIWAGKACEKTQGLNALAAVKFFGRGQRINALTLEDVDDYVAHLQKRGDSGGTINRKLSALSSMLRVAFERGKIAHLIKMPRRKEGEHRIRFLTPEEEASVVHHVRNVLDKPDHADAILMLLYTGFRCGELWRLEARDVDLEHGTMTLWKTKNGHPRTIPIVSKILPIVEARVKRACEEGGGGGRLFPEGSNEWLRRVWEKTRLDLGFAEDTQFVPHMLRHTCATRLAQHGVSMPIIKEWMGHTTIQTTARYAHFSPTDLRNAAEIFR